MIMLENEDADCFIIYNGVRLAQAIPLVPTVYLTAAGGGQRSARSPRRLRVSPAHPG
jgi:hypothetical protein